MLYNNCYPQSERSRKKAELDVTDFNLRISELTSSVTNTTSERRRLETELASLRQELDDAVTAKQETEDKASRAQQEVNRLTEELRLEQESYKNAEAQRRLVESEMRQVSVRLEQAESVGQKEGRRLADRIQAKVSIVCEMNLSKVLFLLAYLIQLALLLIIY